MCDQLDNFNMLGSTIMGFVNNPYTLENIHELLAHAKTIGFKCVIEHGVYDERIVNPGPVFKFESSEEDYDLAGVAKTLHNLVNNVNEPHGINLHTCYSTKVQRILSAPYIEHFSGGGGKCPDIKVYDTPSSFVNEAWRQGLDVESHVEGTIVLTNTRGSKCQFVVSRMYNEQIELVKRYMEHKGITPDLELETLDDDLFTPEELKLIETLEVNNDAHGLKNPRY